MTRLRVLLPGTTDDYAPILQDALDGVAAAGGGEVVVPPGDWPYGGVVTVGDGTTLRGSGGTRLLARDPTRAAIRMTGRFCTVRDLTLDGQALTRGSAGDATGIRLLRAVDATVESVRVTRTAAAGIFVQQSHRFRIAGCTVHDSRADGIHVSGASSHGLIQGCTSFDNGDDLIALVGYGKDGGPVTHMVVTGNLGRNGKARGLSCLGARYVTFQGNVIDGTDAAGLYLHQEENYETYAPSAVTAVGNVLTDVSRRVGHAGLFVGGGKGERALTGGGTLSDGIRDVVLSGNIVDGAGDVGLYVSRWAVGVRGGGNVVRNSRRRPVLIQSEDAAVEVAVAG